jgi:predicted porin
MRGVGTRVAAWALATALLLAPAAAWAAQVLKGYGQVQYQKTDQASGLDDREWWLTVFHLDYANRFHQNWEVSSQVVLSDLNYTTRPDRYKTPQGTLRIAHPVVGLFASYRPVSTTDNRNVTTEQQELMLNGYLQPEHGPRLSGSWIRRHQEQNRDYPAGTGITRNVGATWDVGPASLRAGWGNQSQESVSGTSTETSQDNLSLGSTLRFSLHHMPLSAAYDFARTRRRSDGALSDGTSTHSVVVTGSARLGARTSASLNYAFRHTGVDRGGTASYDDHDGALLGTYTLTRALRLTGGAGVRSARTGERQGVESYTVAGISADGRVRPGWTGSAGLTHSWNWLPGAAPRRVTAAQALSRMNLARGLDLAADGNLTFAGAATAGPDSAVARGSVVLQSGVSLRATPVRSILTTIGARRYQVGGSLGRLGSASTSATWDLQWSPAPRLTGTGRLSRSTSLDPRQPPYRTAEGQIQWSPGARFQASGSYTRTDQAQLIPGSGLLASHEIWSGRAVLGVTRDLRVIVQGSDADPGRPTRARQVNVSVTQNFGG